MKGVGSFEQWINLIGNFDENFVAILGRLLLAILMKNFVAILDNLYELLI